MTAPAPTRAEEGRETGHVAYEAWVEGEGLNLIAVSNLPIMPWRSLSDEAKAIWEAIERKSAAQAEAEVARLTAVLAEAEATASRLHKDNERLRWRHPAVLPDWNDLPDGLRAKLARTADGYDPDWGGDLAVNMYAALRQAMMETPHADK